MEAFADKGVYPHKTYGYTGPSAKQIMVTGRVTVRNPQGSEQLQQLWKNDSDIIITGGRVIVRRSSPSGRDAGCKRNTKYSSVQLTLIL